MVGDIGNKLNLEKDDNSIVQGLWIGPSLSTMERLSIESFLKNGHQYHLYVYDEPRNVPAGTIKKDASEILPSTMIFQYTHQKSYSGFSNFFRYKLLLERGGWWVDSDMVCLRYFGLASEHVFTSEICNDRQTISCGAIKAPRGSRVMEFAWNVCNKKTPELLVWGETGPRLLGEAVSECKISAHIAPAEEFCPVPYNRWEDVITLNSDKTSLRDSFAIHLWNEMWRRGGRDKDSTYPQGCLYEELKRQYLSSED